MFSRIYSGSIVQLATACTIFCMVFAENVGWSITCCTSATICQSSHKEKLTNLPVFASRIGSIGGSCGIGINDPVVALIIGDQLPST
jgi:hypothetical protein